MKEFKVRLILKDGKFQFDEGCFMVRLALKKDWSEWVDASKRDRAKLEKCLSWCAG